MAGAKHINKGKVIVVMLRLNMFLFSINKKRNKQNIKTVIMVKNLR